MLNPNLAEPLQVLHKLEREMHRAFHHQNHIHKSDHFFNFCITALSLKDFVLKYLNITSKQEKQPYYDAWSSVACLQAASEIANTVKHCQLEKVPRTQTVELSKSVVVNMLLNEAGSDFTQIEEVVPDYKITLSDGRELHIYEFTMSVIDYWKVYLQSLGIPYNPQDEHTFFGDQET